MLTDQQPTDLFGNPVIPEFDKGSTRRALDELFSLTQQYRSMDAYDGLLRFVARFRFYAPYNAMLVHVQMPGARYVAPPHRWLQEHGRKIKPGARPLVILQPMGPVMFVFDVSDTEPLPNSPPLPEEVEHPFAVGGKEVGGELEQTLENAKRDGIRVTSRNAGSQSAGQIGVSTAKASQDFLTHMRPQREYEKVPVRYELLLNSDHSREEQYSTLVHELAHLYCGHLGTPNPNWWPDRRGLQVNNREFEAESVCYLVCQRLGIDNPSEKYLAGYMGKNKEVPPISLECVMAASGLIEKMGRERLGLRKKAKEG